MIKRIAYRFFKWYCRPEFFLDISGDLEEMYQDNLVIHSRKRANWQYLKEILLLCRPSLIRQIGLNSIINQMLANHFKISFRHLAKHKSYTFINVLGLALGISGFLIIQLYTSFEKSYDTFHENADQLHRVSFVQMVDGVIGAKDAMGSYPLGRLMQENLPEVQQYTISKKLDKIVFRFGDSRFEENQVISADSSFLDLFSYKVIAGNEDSFFIEPATVVLTSSIAKKYFDDEDPLGKTLEVLAPYETSLKVVGIIEDIPYNTHYRFNMMVSDLTFAGEEDFNSWNYNNHYLYVRLDDNADLVSMQSKMNQMADEQYGEDNTEYWVIDPIEQIHLNSDYTFEPQIHGNQQAVSVMTIIGWTLILIAWVNYVNLSTARSVERAKEVGLRKVVGAIRGQLVGQFIVEAVLINLIAVFASVIMIELALPYYKDIAGNTVIEHFYQDQELLVNLFLISLIGAIISGIYPALVMSGFQPATILKGSYSTSKSGVLLRKVLVTIQFAASFALITSTFIVSDQVQFMQEADKGINVNHVITFELPSSNAVSEDEFRVDMESRKSLINELRQLTTVAGVAGTTSVPGGHGSDISSTTSTISIPGFKDQIDGTTYMQWCDDQFFDVMETDLIFGRIYSSDNSSDSNALVVNEAFLSRIGIPIVEEEVINRRLKLWGEEREIVGVIKDFNRTTLKSSVEPTLYTPWENPRILVARLNPDNYQEGLEDLEEVWSDYHNNLPFNYTFLDDRFERLYVKDFIFGKVFLIFSLISIIVSMLGLFGLSSFSVIQRTKEMGVRKVMGASTTQVALVFFKDFFVLLSAGVVVGTPIVYFAMENWLNSYAFRIDFPWVWVAIAAVAVMFIAFASIGYQIRKVTLVNPAETLKYE